MEKKESLNKKETNADILPKASNLSGRLFWVIKFILGLCFLPFVYSVSVALLNQLGLLEGRATLYLWQGVISFVIIYLFIYEPLVIYQKGQRILEIVFSFFKPLVKVAPPLLPIYTIVIFIVYLLSSLVFESANLIKYFIFLLGFSLALHLVFSSRSMRKGQESPFKPNYLFGFSLVYIINVVLIAFLLNVLFKDFSFVVFFNQSYRIARDIFSAIFNQLFL